MKIKSIHIRRFRSVARASLPNCGVLIGKNNAGKSNILSAIELTLDHLKTGAIAGVWRTSRAKDEFTGRDTFKPVQIGIEFEMTPDFNAHFQEQLKFEAAQLEKAIRDSHSVSAIIAGQGEPGGQILEVVAHKFNVGFSKEKGDSERLASLLSTSAIPEELSNLIREIAGAE